MARVPTKHDRDQPLDFQGFLNNLQDWEHSVKDKEKKLKSHSSREKLIGIEDDERRPMSKTTTTAVHRRTAGENEHLRNYDSMGKLSSSSMVEGSSVDANSEKELGNEYFKQKKFKEAIDCYSRSLALSPTAVAYANRAMAYLKIKRFQEAEEDCTEALNLDDRYVKAYSRRSTARKELGKLKASIDDAEFALRLEPQNQEIKKQYTDAKSKYEKEILEKASGKLRDSKQQVQREGKVIEVIQSLPIRSETTKMSANQDHLKATQANQSNGKKDLKSSVEQLAARAASIATAESAKNITPPTSAYQFEVSWRGLSGDRTLQTHLLKVTSPATLPQIFKNALSAPLLIDIIRCIATFFNDEVDFAVSYLDNLSKVSRFDMIIMCLSSADKAELQKIWDEVFCSEVTPAKYSEMLSKLRSRYGIKP